MGAGGSVCGGRCSGSGACAWIGTGEPGSLLLTLKRTLRSALRDSDGAGRDDGVRSRCSWRAPCLSRAPRGAQHLPPQPSKVLGRPVRPKGLAPRGPSPSARLWQPGRRAPSPLRCPSGPLRLRAQAGLGGDGGCPHPRPGGHGLQAPGPSLPGPCWPAGVGGRRRGEGARRTIATCCLRASGKELFKSPFPWIWFVRVENGGHREPLVHTPPLCGDAGQPLAKPSPGQCVLQCSPR